MPDPASSQDGPGRANRNTKYIHQEQILAQYSKVFSHCQVPKMAANVYAVIIRGHSPKIYHVSKFLPANIFFCREFSVTLPVLLNTTDMIATNKA